MKCQDGFLKSLPCMAPGSHIREVWRFDPNGQNRGEKSQTKVHGKVKADKKVGANGTVQVLEKPGKLSPIKKKVSLCTNPKVNNRDRSGWLFEAAKF